MLRGLSLALVPMQRPLGSRQDDDGFTPSQVIVISAHGLRLGGCQVYVGHTPYERERFRWSSEAEAPRVSAIGKLGDLNLRFHGEFVSTKTINHEGHEVSRRKLAMKSFVVKGLFIIEANVDFRE